MTEAILWNERWRLHDDLVVKSERLEPGNIEYQLAGTGDPSSLQSFYRAQALRDEWRIVDEIGAHSDAWSLVLHKGEVVLVLGARRFAAQGFSLSLFASADSHKPRVMVNDRGTVEIWGIVIPVIAGAEPLHHDDLGFCHVLHFAAASRSYAETSVFYRRWAASAGWSIEEQVLAISTVQTLRRNGVRIDITTRPEGGLAIQLSRDEP